MNYTTYVPLSNEILINLVKRYGDSYADYIEYAVEDFLERTEDDFDTSKSIDELIMNKQGYTWGNLY